MNEKDSIRPHRNTTYIIAAGLLKMAVIFTGLGFYGIAKMQRYLKSVIEYDYSIEVLLNST